MFNWLTGTLNGSFELVELAAVVESDIPGQRVELYRRAGSA